MSFHNHDSEDPIGNRYGQKKQFEKEEKENHFNPIGKNPILKELRDFIVSKVDKHGNLNFIEVLYKINEIDIR